MNQHNVLNQPTRVLLTITALLAVIVLANWLWTLTTFWSDVYVGGNKWQTLFYYHLYRLPTLIIVGLTLTAFFTKNTTLLLGNIFLSFFSYYYIYGAIWLLKDQLIKPELIEQVPLLNEWVVLLLVLLSSVTFILDWVIKNAPLENMSKLIKYLLIYIVILSLFRIISSNLTVFISSPLVYWSSSQWTLLQQIQYIVSMLPHLFLALFAIWIMMTQRYQYFLVIALAGIYYTFLADIPLIQGIAISWGKTNILAISSTISSISMLVFYLSSLIIFIVWLYRWQQEKK